jgi:hypothetical protein
VSRIIGSLRQSCALMGSKPHPAACALRTKVHIAAYKDVKECLQDAGAGARRSLF